MKAKVFSASLLLAGLAFAGTTEVTNEYVLGAMPLAISGTEVIINIPWVEAGTAGGGVAVTNLVKTTGLVAGDNLLWYSPSDSKYRIWQATNHGGVLYWDAVSSITEIGSSRVASDSPVLARGQALILKRQTPGDPTTIYIVGQYTSASASAITVSKGFNLLAPPIVGGSVNLATCTWTGAADGDAIILASGTRYVRNDGSWGQWTYDKETGLWSFEAVNSSIPVSAGQGIWYERFANASFDFSW